MVLQNFNSYYDKLQFTIELEKNNQISFLNFTLHHITKTIKTEWHTKDTWFSRYLNFKSQHPLTHKKSVIIRLADRSINLSEPEFRENGIIKAKDALILNNILQIG